MLLSSQMLSSQMLENAGNPDNAPRLFSKIQCTHGHNLRILTLSFPQVLVAFSLFLSLFLSLSFSVSHSLISLPGSLGSLSLASLSLHESDRSLLLHKTNEKTYTFQPYFAQHTLLVTRASSGTFHSCAPNVDALVKK
mmetsp:Transcript_37610/g.55235  ORF Transcript_37610/g.55235 Transcript_37610/m.55235 type:complete len:138 (-) Transcript_37610:160-573(-)